VDAQVSHLFSEVKAENSIAVAQQVTRELVKGKGLPQLLRRPLCGRVGSHIEMQNATPVMGQYQKHVEHLKTKSRNSEEVNRDHLGEMVL